MIGSHLRRFQPERRYLVPDKETEGLSLFYSRPWDISWLIADANKVYEREQHYLWFPDLKVSQQAAQITRFDYVLYKDRAEDPRKVLDRYEERLFDTSLDVVGQNFFYDGYIHKTLRRVCGLPFIDYPWLPRLLDTNCLSKAYRMSIKPDLVNFVAWQFKMKNTRIKAKTNLGAMCAEFGIPFDPHQGHNSLYDIDRTRDLFEALKWKVDC